MIRRTRPTDRKSSVKASWPVRVNKTGILPLLLADSVSRCPRWLSMYLMFSVNPIIPGNASWTLVCYVSLYSYQLVWRFIKNVDLSSSPLLPSTGVSLKNVQKKQIWHKEPRGRCNHLFQILSKSVKGFPAVRDQKWGFPIDYYRRPFNSSHFLTTVLPVTCSTTLSKSAVWKLDCVVQCHSVTITILGQEGVPVHVDGEAWIQPPSRIRIHHKNRAQMLINDKVHKISSVITCVVNGYSILVLYGRTSQFVLRS